jgi:hypothetical protein
VKTREDRCFFMSAGKAVRDNMDLSTDSFGKGVPKTEEIAERMELSRPIEAEILHSLTEGRRTAGELTERIFGVTKENENYHTYYMKVFRAAKTLHRQGYLSTRLFGRDRPYKLTPFAAAKMMEIEEVKRGLLLPHDVAAYFVAIGLALLNIYLAATSMDWLSGPGTVVPYSLLLFMTGYCSSRLLFALWKVS